MKKRIVTSALLAAAIAITPATATDKKAKPDQQKAQQAQKLDKKAPCKEDKDCLDTELKRLEAALDKVGNAVGSRMEEEAGKLAAAQAELHKAKAECAALHKRIAAAETSAKNITAEFNAFKASNEKQRRSTMASLTKLEEAAKRASEENAELNKKNQHLEAQCKAACERLKKINDALEKAEKQLAASKK